MSKIEGLEQKGKCSVTVAQSSLILSDFVAVSSRKREFICPSAAAEFKN